MHMTPTARSQPRAARARPLARALAGAALLALAAAPPGAAGAASTPAASAREAAGAAGPAIVDAPAHAVVAVPAAPRPPLGPRRPPGDGPRRPPVADGPADASRVVRLAGPTRFDAWQRRRDPADVAAAAARIAADLDAVAAVVAAGGGRLVSRYDSALAGALVHLPPGDAPRLERRLRAMPGVVAVDRAPLATVAVHPTNAGPAAPDVIARRNAAAADALPAGHGTTIAVLDTGVDYTHAAFGGPGTILAYAAAALAPTRVDDVWDGRPLFPTARVVRGVDVAGERYLPGCTAAAEARGLCRRTPEPDPDPLDSHGHGTHVAGIAAGDATPHVPAGVAPGANLVAVKVFGAGAQTDLLLDGLEWTLEANLAAAMDGAPRAIDVVNLSLGIAYGAKVLVEAGAIARLTASGAVVVAAAGNDGNLPFIVGAPAIAPEALAVASHVPPGQHSWELWLARPGEPTPEILDRRTVYHQPWSPDPGADVEAPVARVGRGCPAGGAQPADPFAADPSGALGLFYESWGEGGEGCTATTQAQRLAAAGAVGALFHLKLGLTVASRWDGDPSVRIPVWAISDDVADRIAADAAQGITVTARLHRVPDPDRDDTPSSFTSRGPGRNGALKPEVSAPGQLILAPYLGTGDRGARFSGTSMAAPHAAGAAAVARAAWRARGVALDAPSLGRLLVTTADADALRVSAADSDPPPLSLSGGGAVDAAAAGAAAALLAADGRATIDLGLRALTAPVTVPVAVAITNASTQTVTYQLSPRFREAGDDRGAVAFGAVEAVAAPGARVTTTLAVAIDPARFIGWPMAGGAAVSDADSLSAVEIDGWCEVEAHAAGTTTRVGRLPFYLLGRRASRLAASWTAPAEGGPPGPIELANDSPYPGTAEWFTLIARDGAESDVPDKVDLDAVGVRAEPDPEGSGNTIVSFALHSRGVRAHPLETWLAIEIDTDDDGAADYRLSLEDEELVRTGAFRSGSVIAWLASADGGGLGVARRYHAGVDLASRFTVLPLQIEDTGLTPSRLRFRFRVIAQDIVDGDLYRDPLVDTVPDGGGWLTYDGRDPDAVFGVARWTVPMAGGARVALPTTAGAVGRPDPDRGRGIGLLGLFPANPPGDGDAALLGPEADAPALWLPWVGAPAAR